MAGSDNSEKPKRGYIARIIYGIFVILAVGVLILIAINYTQAGIVGTAFTSFYSTAQQTGIVAALSSTYTTVNNALFNPQSLQKGFSFESEVETAQTDPDLGVKITRFEQYGSPNYGEPIQMSGTISAKMPEDSSLLVYCQLGDEKPVSAFVSSTSAVNNEVRLKQGNLQTFEAQCEFPKGIMPEKATYVSGVTTNINAPLEKTTGLPISASKVAKMLVLFEYKTTAKLRVYLMNSAELQALQNSNQDPFKYYNINDPNLRSDKTLASVTTPGPINLGMNTVVSEPFVENRPFAVITQISSNSDWLGNMKKLESLYLLTDPVFRLESDADYGEKHFTSACAFDPTNQKDQYGYSIYTLKESEIARLNQQCDTATLKSTSLTEQNCIDLFGKNKDTKFFCNAKAIEIPHTGLKYYIIGAEARYIYQTERDSSATAINTYPTTPTPTPLV